MILQHYTPPRGQKRTNSQKQNKQKPNKKTDRGWNTAREGQTGRQTFTVLLESFC